MGQSKFNRYERKQLQQEKIAASLAGSGLYVFKNPSRTGTLTLPKALASGRKTVGPGEEFQGDSYYMNLVRTGDLMKIRTIMSPEQEKAIAEEKTAAIKREMDIQTALAEKAAEERVLFESIEEKTSKLKTRKAETVTPKTKKLVLDQPDRVTVEGKVEQVVREEEVQQLHDHDNKRQPEVLLNEHPVGEIIIE